MTLSLCIPLHADHQMFLGLISDFSKSKENDGHYKNVSIT